jgi:hypothetical protein
MGWFIGGRVVLNCHTIVPSMKMMIWNSYRRRRRRVVVIAAMSVITGWVLVSAVVARRRSVMTVVLIRLVFIPPVRPMVTITMQLSLFPATSSKG